MGGQRAGELDSRGDGVWAQDPFESIARPPGEPDPRHPADLLSPELPHAATTSPTSIFMGVFQLLSRNAKKTSVQRKKRAREENVSRLK